MIIDYIPESLPKLSVLERLEPKKSRACQLPVQDEARTYPASQICQYVNFQDIL